MEGFYTVTASVSAEQVIDKSRFIAHIAHVSTPQEVEEHLEQVKTEYPNARHYVYAYRLHQGRQEKASDDGEPQGTGGRPVLDLLQYRKLWDVQIIVVRYFGGVLLGTGGLTRAYGGTARLVIDEKADITFSAPHAEYFLKIPYPWFEQIKYHVYQKEWEIDGEQFQEDVGASIFVPAEETEIFEKWLDEFTNKQVSREKIRDVLRSTKND